MGAGSCCLKCLLIFANVLLGIIGLVLLAVGIFVKVGAKDYINKYAGNVLQTAITLPSEFQFADGSMTTSGPPVLDFTVFLAPVAAVLIAFGAAIAILAFLGAFGACCNSKCLLGTYIAVVAVIILAEIILAIVFFTGKANKPIQSFVLSTLVNYYVDIDDYGIYSMTWNYVMLQFKCCGLYNYDDFKAAKVWRRSRSVVGSDGGVSTVNLTTPIACCKLQGEFPNVKIKDDTCALVPTNLTSNWMTGCWEGVTTFLGGYRSLVVGIITAIICVEIVFMIIAIVLCCAIDKEKVDVA